MAFLGSRVSAPAEDHGDADYLGLPPLAANELILCLIWEHIALLHTGSLEDRSDAALPSFLFPVIAIATLSLSSRKEA